MKLSDLFELYRASAAPGPSAATDEFILAAARAQRSRTAFRRPVMLAFAAALVVVITVRWFDPAVNHAQTTDFGIAEGHARAWLMTIAPPALNGPGSQEGLP